MAQPSAKNHMDRLVNRSNAVAAAIAALDEEIYQRQKAADLHTVGRILGQLRAVLDGTVKCAGNTLRHKGSYTSPWYTGPLLTSQSHIGELYFESFRVKARIFGSISLLGDHEVEAMVRSFLVEELQKSAGTDETIEIREVKFERYRNWWRGSWPTFYNEFTEDDFNFYVFLGLPAISRTAAYWVDGIFPRVSVRATFSRVRREPVVNKN